MTRTNDLAKIHIAKKHLRINDDDYRYIIATVGRAQSGSSADLNETGRRRVIAHFESKGWQPTKRKKSPLMASDSQLELIRNLWADLYNAGAINTPDEAALRTWLQSNTRKFHPQKAGYAALNFLPKWVAVRVIEQLKKWILRLEKANEQNA
ncbi:MAG: regulatory protein GemA [Gammaproteobacteria bacterium]|nr:regulatory protein GemA [Gammaproteobacteria bacterium]